MRNTNTHSGLVSGVTVAVTFALLALLPGILMGMAQRRARRMPAETRSSYSESFSISRWMYAVALLNCLLGAGIICLGIAHPNGEMFFSIMGGAFVGLGAGVMILFRRAFLVITESEISYRFGREKWRVGRGEIERVRLRRDFLPVIVIDTGANSRGRLILLMFGNTGRILFLLGIR